MAQSAMSDHSLSSTLRQRSRAGRVADNTPNRIRRRTLTPTHVDDFDSLKCAALSKVVFYNFDPIMIVGPLPKGDGLGREHPVREGDDETSARAQDASGFAKGLKRPSQILDGDCHYDRIERLIGKWELRFAIYIMDHDFRQRGIIFQLFAIQP